MRANSLPLQVEMTPISVSSIAVKVVPLYEKDQP